MKYLNMPTLQLPSLNSLETIEYHQINIFVKMVMLAPGNRPEFMKAGDATWHYG